MKVIVDYEAKCVQSEVLETAGTRTQIYYINPTH